MKKVLKLTSIVSIIILSFSMMTLADFTIIEQGSSGDAVVQIQKKLIEQGYLEGEADGSFGNNTKNAVIAFQVANGIDATGIVDENTYNFLTGAGSSSIEGAEDSAEADIASTETQGGTVDLQTVTTTDDLENIIAEDTKGTIAGLVECWKALTETITDYDSYVSNIDQVENFYTGVESTQYQLLVRMREYAARYAQLVLSSGKSKNDMYDDLESMSDVIYDDAFDDISDGIYDDLFDEVNDYFYNGILDEAPDGVEYSDWADIHSKDWDMYSDAHSEIWDDYSDFHGDIWDFYCDVHGEIWDEDYDRAQEKVNKFIEKTLELKDDKTEGVVPSASGEDVSSSDVAPEVRDEGTEVVPTTETPVTEAPAVDTSDSGAVSPELKEFLDSYEAFVDEYIEFMKTYDSSDLSAMTKYYELLQKEIEFSQKADAYDEGEMSDADTLYYTEVMLRCSQKLSEAAISMG